MEEAKTRDPRSKEDKVVGGGEGGMNFKEKEQQEAYRRTLKAVKHRGSCAPSVGKPQRQRRSKTYKKKRKDTDALTKCSSFGGRSVDLISIRKWVGGKIRPNRTSL